MQKAVDLLEECFNMKFTKYLQLKYPTHNGLIKEIYNVIEGEEIELSKKSLQMVKELFPDWKNIGDELDYINFIAEKKIFSIVLDRADDTATLREHTKLDYIDFDYLHEARPKMISFKLKKTNHYWTLKNLEDGKLIMLPQLSISRLRMFLKDTNACDNNKPISFGMDYDRLKEELIEKGEVTINIPANRVQYMKAIYAGEKVRYGNMKKYKFNNVKFDVDDYTKVYKY